MIRKRKKVCDKRRKKNKQKKTLFCTFFVEFSSGLSRKFGVEENWISHRINSWQVGDTKKKMRELKRRF